MSSTLKIFIYIAFSISLFFIKDAYLHLFIAFSVFFILLFIPFRKIRQGILPIGIFILFTFAGNLFFNPGKIIFGKGFFLVTDEGLRLACIRALRVFSMIGSAKILTAMLSLDEIIRAMAMVLRPFERIGLPVTEFFHVMGLTVKSFPLLTDCLSREYRKEIKDNNMRGFRNRMRHMVLFLMPVFIKSIQSPEDFFIAKEDETGH